MGFFKDIYQDSFYYSSIESRVSSGISSQDWIRPFHVLFWRFLKFLSVFFQGLIPRLLQVFHQGTSRFLQGFLQHFIKNVFWFPLGISLEIIPLIPTKIPSLGFLRESFRHIYRVSFMNFPQYSYRNSFEDSGINLINWNSFQFTIIDFFLDSFRDFSFRHSFRCPSRGKKLLLDAFWMLSETPSKISSGILALISHLINWFLILFLKYRWQFLPIIFFLFVFRDSSRESLRDSFKGFFLGIPLRISSAIPSEIPSLISPRITSGIIADMPPKNVLRDFYGESPWILSGIPS